MHKEQKAFFTDLDGTLLDDKKEITEGNRRAINTALEQGHKIVIATGRPLPGAMMQAEKLGLTREGCYAITYNGALIYDIYNQKVLYSRPLPLELVNPLFAAAKDMGIHIQTYNSSHILSLEETPELKHYSAENRLPYEIVEDAAQALKTDPHKLIAISLDNPEKLREFQEKVLSKYDDIIESFLSNASYLEIVAKDISKGFAVRWLCDYLEIPIENSVAAGDAQNDIAMLEAAHVGAVMCNAFPGIAEHGNYVTEADNNHDGVAEIIEKFILD